MAISATTAAFLPGKTRLKSIAAAATANRFSHRLLLFAICCKALLSEGKDAGGRGVLHYHGESVQCSPFREEATAAIFAD